MQDCRPARTKLERIRSSNFEHHRPRTATELLNESKAFFVKTEAVLNSSTSPLPRASKEHSPPESDHSIEELDSISLLSLSDQSPNKRAVLPSSVSVVERNARIIKWLFQLHQVNSSPSFVESSEERSASNSKQ